jgi:hypothetical protein
MMEIGVANPSAQGHATISTDIAAISAWAKRGSGPSNTQLAKASIATAITAGTNHRETAEGGAAGVSAFGGEACDSVICFLSRRAFRPRIGGRITFSCVFRVSS